MLGKILTQTGRAVEGEKYLRSALALRTNTVKKGHWSVAIAQGALGECLTVQKRYAEAEVLFLDSYAALNSGLGKQDPRTKEALRRLASLYDLWNKPAQAAQYRALS